MRRMLETIRTAAGYEDWSVGVSIVAEKEILRLNSTYRAKAHPTDILSFAHHQLSSPEVFPATLDVHDRDLGDLIVCPSIIAQDAAKLASPLDAHWRRILVHGFVHLLGYDHETDHEYEAMSRREEVLLRAVNDAAAQP